MKTPKRTVPKKKKKNVKQIQKPGEKKETNRENKKKYRNLITEPDRKKEKKKTKICQAVKENLKFFRRLN